MPRPRGLPKTGGRRKGTPNRTNVATRERIESEADPIGFLCRVNRGDDVDGEIPTLDQRMTAAKILADKVLPDLRSVEMEHSTIQSEVTELSDAELEAMARGDFELYEAGRCVVGSTAVVVSATSQTEPNLVYPLHETTLLCFTYQSSISTCRMLPQMRINQLA